MGTTKKIIDTHVRHMHKLFNNYVNLPIQAKASFWFLVCSFLNKGILFITTPIFTRLLTAQEYGEYSVFVSWYSMAMIVITLNLSWGVYMQGLVKFEDDHTAFSSSLQGLTICLVLVWATLYFLFHNWINNLIGLNTCKLCCMFIMIWTSAVFGFWSAEKRVNLQYKQLVLITVLASIFSNLLGIYLVLYTEDKVLGRILGITVVQLLLYGWMAAIQIFKGKKFYSKKYWLYALTFNIPLIPHYFSLTVLNNSDRIMIDTLVGKTEAGIYSLAYSIGLIMTIVSTSVMATLRPWIFQKIKHNSSNEITKPALSCLVLIGLVNIILIAIAPEIVCFFAPVEYYDAIWIIPPVAMSTYFIFSYDLFASFEFYYEKTTFIMFASIVSALLNILLNYVFINLFGYIAAGYTTIVSYMIYAIGHYMFMQKICRDFDNVVVFNGKVLVLLASLFLFYAGVFTVLYNFRLIRYCFIIFTVLLLYVFKDKVNNIIHIFLVLKKVK